LCIEVAERERVRALLDLHAVVDATAHEARALERLVPGRANHEDGVLAVLHVFVQSRKPVVAQQAAADVGLVQVAEPQFDERFGRSWQADFLGAHDQTLDGAHLDQFVPAVVLAGSDEARLRAHGGRDDAGLARDCRARGGDDLVLRDHGDGGAGNGVHAEHVLVRARWADFDGVLDRFADVLVVEVDQGRFGNAQQQDRLGCPCRSASPPACRNRRACR